MCVIATLTSGFNTSLDAFHKTEARYTPTVNGPSGLDVFFLGDLGATVEYPVASINSGFGFVYLEKVPGTINTPSI